MVSWEHCICSGFCSEFANTFLGLIWSPRDFVPILSRYVFFAKLIALKQSFLNLSTLVLVSDKHPFLRNFLYCLFCFFIILHRLSVIQGGSLGWILTKLLGIQLLAILRNLLLKNSTCLEGSRFFRWFIQGKTVTALFIASLLARL